MERIAFAGDWHANGRWAAYAIGHAAEQGAQAIVHCGDYGYHFNSWYLLDVEKALRKAGIELWFIDGNHEDYDTLHKFPVIDEQGARKITKRVRHIPRGYHWNWNGVKFLGCGGAHSIDHARRTLGKSWWLQERITEEDEHRCYAAGQADVLVTHDAPQGIQVPGLHGNLDVLNQSMADEQRERLRRIAMACQPQTIVHGHHHISYESTVWFGDHGPVQVRGLDCDGTWLEANLWIVDTADLR